MGENTKISWAHHTQNFWTGCSKVSPACDNCYAESWSKRSGIVIWGDEGTRRRTSATNWRNPYKWNARAKANGERERVFVNSLSDWAEARPELDSIRHDMFKVIGECEYLDFLLLTKRADNIKNCLPDDWGAGYPNVWLGVTVENQEWADERLPHLLAVPAVIHFISAEPLLGSIDLMKLYPNPSEPWHSSVAISCTLMGGQRFRRADWVITGGESGPHHRPLSLDHVRSLRDQCNSSGVAFFFKQHGGLRPDSNGCLLDGREYKGFPQVTR